MKQLKRIDNDLAISLQFWSPHCCKYNVNMPLKELTRKMQKYVKLFQFFRNSAAHYVLRGTGVGQT